MLLVSPFFIYIGNNYQTNDNFLYNILLLLGVLLFLYHGQKVYKVGIKIGLINAIHVFIFAPVMIYLGIQKNDSLVSMYPILTLLGYASLGYHTQQLIFSYN
jgi:hypothetical protein